MRRVGLVFSLAMLIVFSSAMFSVASAHPAAGADCSGCHSDQAAQWASPADLHAASAQDVLGSTDHNSQEVPKDNCLLCHSAFQFFQYNGSVDSTTTGFQIPDSALGPVDLGGGPYYANAVTHFVSPIAATGPWTISNAGDWQATKCEVCHDPSATNPAKLAKYGAVLDGNVQSAGWYFNASLPATDTHGLPDAYRYVYNVSTHLFDQVAYSDQTTLPVEATKVCVSCHGADDQGGDPAIVKRSTNYGAQGGDSRSFVTAAHKAFGCADCHQTHDFAPVKDPRKDQICNRAGCHVASGPAKLGGATGAGVVHINHIPTVGTSVTLKTSLGSLRRGHSLVLKSTLSGAVPTRTIVRYEVKKPNSRKYVSVASRTVSSSGTSSLTYKPTSRGRYYFRVRFSGAPGFNGSISKSRLVIVR